MEENQNPVAEQVQETPEVEAVTQPETVNFSPIPVKSSKPKRTKTFLGLFVLVIFVVGGFLIFKDSGTSPEDTLAPETQGVTIDEEPTAGSPAPTSVPVDKTKIVIEIQNGTGITGEAAYLRDILKVAGYSDFKVGNSTTTDNVTTSVTYASDLEQSVRDEITEKLKSLYKEVDVKLSATQKTGVVVVTGLKKGATAKPSASPSASPTTSPTATPST